MSRYGSDCKVYVGDLGNSASKQELEDAFRYYGPLRNVWVARNPPGFAFVEFEDARDAEDAIRGLDGRTICGRRARVEMSNGKSGSGRYRGPPPRSRGRPFHPDDRCYECGDRGHYARDCNRYRRGGRHRSRSRSRSRSRDRRSRSRSNSRSRSRSRNRSRSRSGSGKRSRSRSRTGDKNSRSRSRSRSRSAPKENGNATEKD
ncbi:serine/arginine-rich splicing factor 7 isoform X1 [Tribolium castaneum]|uniref:RNA-binding protein 1-like Protein n=1 Tax=Tribolium castaneum TaxID=7070 RepID=D6X2L1_TRICA|nr:PREDICTED: serine/arginine-rich splicing factor 7 isoform X1 [Tribolium castaneum]EFA09429.1 RNA-binding protein 1-like Protein [Tribolium castaneum]|eukprot:XP_008199911.1 PREDICTED: serine/arginine-rich splicing factor 7 isoform X1 [Tribolium castaneum]